MKKFYLETYDKGDAVYISFPHSLTKAPRKSMEIDEWIILDYNDKGEPVGIEIAGSKAQHFLKTVLASLSALPEEQSIELNEALKYILY